MKVTSQSLVWTYKDPQISVMCHGTYTDYRHEELEDSLVCLFGVKHSRVYLNSEFG